MNNKIISHQEASKKIKELQIKQKVLKTFRDYYFKFKKIQNATDCQSSILRNKKEINMLLSIIFWHKKSKNMFAKTKKEKHE